MDSTKKYESILKEILVKLLRKHELLMAAGSEKSAEIGTNESVFKPYSNNQPLGIAHYVNNAIHKYIKEGVLEATWHTENISLKRIYLKDFKRVCEVAGYVPSLEKREIALATLDDALSNIPLYHALRDEIEDKWKHGRLYQRLSEEQFNTLSHGILGAHHVQDLYSNKLEMDYRHFSIKVYNDSKKLSTYKGLIANILKSSNSELEGLDPEDVFRYFGITPIEHPILISGGIQFLQEDVCLEAGFFPAIGLFFSDSIKIVIKENINIVTSIENQASFMRYVKEEKSANEIVLYTAGIPTPNLLSLYRAISNALNEQVDFRHWGDIDLGGFKILNVLDKSLNRNVKPYRMSPKDYPKIKELKDLSKLEKEQLKKLSNTCSEELIDEIISVGKKYEQELWQGALVN